MKPITVCLLKQQVANECIDSGMLTGNVILIGDMGTTMETRQRITGNKLHSTSNLKRFGQLVSCHQAYHNSI